VAKEFEFENCIGCFVTDNTTNNDTTITALDQLIHDNGGVRFDLKMHRLRCLGHIINLAAKTLFFGADAKALEIKNSIRVEKILAKETAQAHLTKKLQRKLNLPRKKSTH